MTSQEYLNQLQKYLKKLPQSDYEDAMEYFTEYFADAGPENEQAVIEELGTPKIAAAELMMNLLDKKMDEHTAMEQEEKRNEKKKTTGASVIWIAVLTLFAAPIGAPVLIMAMRRPKGGSKAAAPVKSRLQAPVNTKARQSRKRVEPAAR